MFDKLREKLEKDKNEKSDSYLIDTDNLAIPEIHTGKVKVKDTEETEHKTEVIYETVAVPEVHIGKDEKSEH